MKRILVIIVVVSLAFMFNPIAFGASEGEILSKTKKLYLELMAFKVAPNFHSVGSMDFEIHDGSSRKYYKYANWLKEIRSINNDDARKLLKYGFVPGDIEMLAREYRRSKGNETNYSKGMNKRLRAVFDLDSASKNIPKGKILTIIKEDIACMKMEYYEQFYKAIEVGDYASTGKIIAQPRCIDLYIGTKVEGPLESVILKYDSSKYIKIKHENKDYWIEESMVKQ